MGVRGCTRPQTVSQLLVQWGRGDDEARKALIPLVYNELRRLARHYLWRERSDHSLGEGAFLRVPAVQLGRHIIEARSDQPFESPSQVSLLIRGKSTRAKSRRRR